MTIDQAIRDRLLATAGVTGIVGSGTAARIYPGRIHQGAALPAIRYFRVATNQASYLGGLSPYASVLFQIDSYAATYTAALDLAERIRVGLTTWGPGAAAGGGLLIHGAQLSNQSGPTWSPPPDASTAGRWESSVDVRIQHTETVTVS